MWLRALLFHLAIAFVLRLEFLLMNRKVFSAASGREILWAFVFGLRFDLFVFGLLIALPFVLIRFRRTFAIAFFLLGEFCFFLLGSLDCGFYPFFGRRISKESFALIHEASGKIGGIFDTHGIYILVWFLLVLMFGVLARVLFLSGGRVAQPHEPTRTRRPVVREVIRWVMGLAIIVIMIRGGFQKKPLNFVHGQVFEQNELNQLVLNTGFTLVQSLGRVTLKKEHFFDYEEMMKDLNGTGSAQVAPILPSEKFKNVVVILVESLSYEFFDRGGGRDVPFLKKLSSDSLFFQDAFANARRSIEGVASVVSGVPSLMNEPFISSTFSNNHLVGLGQIFRDRGFETYFFHGGYNGTMYFDQYAQHAGFDHYVGAHEYANTYGKKDDDETWGIFDGPFTKYMADILCDQREKPFLSVLFTLTSHHPFHIPAELDQKFPTYAAEDPIERAMRYTDDALRQFFDRVKTCESFRDTLFVVTADHAFNPLSREYQNGLGEFRIPILFYSPAVKDWPRQLTRAGPVSQIDLIPSISDLMRFENHPQNFLARSLFRPGTDRKVILFEDQHYWLVKKNLYLYEKNADEPELYSREDLGQTLPLANRPERDQFEHELKSEKQFFSEGLWYDRLYLENH